MIGQNVPFITGQFASAGVGGGVGAINPFQTIERRDVGLTLRVRPQVGENGKVRMTVFQENSSVVADTSSNSAGPTTNKSSIESTVEVEDGQIMVLGGLLKDQYSDVARQGARPRRRTRIRRPVPQREPHAPQDQPDGVPAPRRAPRSAAAEQVTLDRYESIRALQKDAQPPASRVLPINEAPVLPPLRAPGEEPAQPSPVQPQGTSPAPPGLPTPSPAPASAPAR